MVRIIEYVEDRYDCLKWKAYKFHDCEDEESAFEKMYALNRESRYDNMRKYTFDDGASLICLGDVIRSKDARAYEDAERRNRYSEWHKGYNTIEHFYGGGLVYD